MRSGRSASSARRTPTSAAKTAAKPADVAVVSSRDYQRIKSSLRPVEVTDLEAERAAKHERAKARAATWQNTLVAKHAATADRYRAAKDAEEARKLALDAEEAAYQAAKREDAIARANELLYYETDLVKGFNSGILAAECLRERQLQIELKARKDAAIRARDEAYGESILNEADAHAAREEREFEERRSRQAALKAEQRAQAEERALMADVERAQNAAEGEMIRRQAAEHAVAEAAKAEARRSRARSLKQESLDVNSHLMQIKKEERARERLEDARVARYRQQVEQRALETRAREAAIKAQREAQHDAMTARQLAEAQARQKKEFEWVERHVATAEERNAAEDQRRRAALAASKRDVHAQHAGQIAARRAEKAAELERELAFIRMGEAEAAAADAVAAEEAAARKMEAEELARYHKAQMETQREQNNWDRTHNENQLAVDQAREAEEQARLEAYYAAVVAEAEGQGVPLYPIRKAYAAAARSRNPLRPQ